MPRRGDPGLARGPVAGACCSPPLWTRPWLNAPGSHRDAVPGRAGWVEGGGKCPPTGVSHPAGGGPRPRR